MKVTGTGPGAASGVEETPQAATARPTEATDATAGSKFAEHLCGPSAATAPTSVVAARGASGPDGVPGVADIGAELEAGRIDAARAVDLVVGRVLDGQLGAGAPPALRARLEETLRATLSEDPMLGARLQRLGRAR